MAAAAPSWVRVFFGDVVEVVIAAGVAAPDAFGVGVDEEFFVVVGEGEGVDGERFVGAGWGEVFRCGKDGGFVGVGIDENNVMGGFGVVLFVFGSYFFEGGVGVALVGPVDGGDGGLIVGLVGEDGVEGELGGEFVGWCYG